MRKISYIVAVVICALFLGFAGILVLGSFVLKGEKAIEAGLLWVYSVPVSILIGFLVGSFSFRWYANLDGTYAQGLGLLGVSLVVGAITPLCIIVWI